MCVVWQYLDNKVVLDLQEPSSCVESQLTLRNVIGKVLKQSNHQVVSIAVAKSSRFQDWFFKTIFSDHHLATRDYLFRPLPIAN